MPKGDRPPRLTFAPVLSTPASMAPSSQTPATDDDDTQGGDFESQSPLEMAMPPSSSGRRLRSARGSDHDLRSRMPSRPQADETSRLLGTPGGRFHSYSSVPTTPKPNFTRAHSSASAIAHGQQSELSRSRHLSRSSSWGFKLASAVNATWRRNNEDNMAESKGSLFTDDRVWYDQYTSTDWVHDSIADNFRVRDLRSRKDFRGRVYAWFDGAQGWILAAIVGCITACIAYFVDVTENSIFDIKEGYCSTGVHIPKSDCCLNEEDCPLWRTWGDTMNATGGRRETIDLAFYVMFVVLFSLASCILTLTTKTTVASTYSLPTVDENLGARPTEASDDAKLDSPPSSGENRPNTITYYPAAGSGVAEVKVILSGFVVHGYLGVKTLVIKTLALILSVASGLSLGKEGPFVHIATCVGNVMCRMFSKYNHNDGKRREILSASSAAGVGVAFGAPIAGTLFSLEEVSYYFPPKTLFRTFFCAIASALTLKFLNPYGTGKIVIFEVRYITDWKFFEIFAFILLGAVGGAMGAMFIKASRFWARTFRPIPLVKKWPLFEVLLVALITGFLSFWNVYAKKAVTELLFELASPCSKAGHKSSLCPQDVGDIKDIVGDLLIAFVIKAFLTTITFGLKIPAGIYVPSMVVGGLLGRAFGHAIQFLALTYPTSPVFASCSASAIGGIENCVTPGVYALIAAGATMCGVTRLSVTLVVILFELTGSLDHVLPFSLSVLVAKWTADALEPLSIYDLLTEMNSYPFLDNKIRPVFTSELGDITHRVRSERLIDVSSSPLVPAVKLRRKLDYLHEMGELDGGLPILREGVLVGLIPAPDLEFALDKLEDEDEMFCLMAATPGQGHGHGQGANALGSGGGGAGGNVGEAARANWGLGGFGGDEEQEEQVEEDPTDFTSYIDPAPVALDIHSPMDLVYQCFVKLGLRFICVLRDGKFIGLVHKKAFVKYVKELEEEDRRRGSWWLCA